jgi:hypothetical protein
MQHKRGSITSLLTKLPRKTGMRKGKSGKRVLENEFAHPFIALTAALALPTSANVSSATLTICYNFSHILPLRPHKHLDNPEFGLHLHP